MKRLLWLFVLAFSCSLLWAQTQKEIDTLNLLDRQEIVLLALQKTNEDSEKQIRTLNLSLLNYQQITKDYEVRTTDLNLQLKGYKILTSNQEMELKKLSTSIDVLETVYKKIKRESFIQKAVIVVITAVAIWGWSN